MSTLKETIDYKGMSVNIYYDEYADSPAEWGNEECFLCSDYRDLYLTKEVIKAEQCRDAVEQNKWFLNGYYIFPVSIYDHSGIAVHLGTSRGWDYSNGRAFVCVKRKKGWSYAKSEAEKIAQSVLDEWNEYLSGEVYGFVAKDEDDNEIYSCWGFYGEDGLEEAIAEAKGEIDCELEKRHKAKIEAYKTALAKFITKRKAQIVSRAPLYARTAFAY